MTGEVAEQVVDGFLRAAAIDRLLGDAKDSSGPGIVTRTHLAGAKNVNNTREGIENAIAAATSK